MTLNMFLNFWENALKIEQNYLCKTTFIMVLLRSCKKTTLKSKGWMFLYKSEQDILFLYMSVCATLKSASLKNDETECQAVLGFMDLVGFSLTMSGQSNL